MAKYGMTSEGVNIKRLDTILDEMHTSLTQKWGVNTRQNSQSYLNAMLTDIADHIAELWEFGEDVYNNGYPSTAEGMFLDNVSQFSGIFRETEKPSYYYILCTGTDGTIIPVDSIIASNTNPKTELRPIARKEISRSTFNTAVIGVTAIDGNALKVVLNGTVYSTPTSSTTSASEALQALCDVISDDDFNVYIGEDALLHIEAKDETSANTLALSDNLTTATVGTVITYATIENGDIYLPAGTVTEIVKSVTGLQSVTNVGTYIAGRMEETDVEYRQSYTEKIFARSSRMVQSIKSAILNNCQGVTSVAVYENDKDVTDESGRYPHSVEVVCNGGDQNEIAQQILNTKAAGISTYGSVEVDLTGDNEEIITIRFNRPTNLNIWFHVSVAIAQGATLPADYADTIKTTILDIVSGMACGEDVIPQKMILPEIYKNVYGIDYAVITMGQGESKPATYPMRNIYTNVRELATTKSNMIEVVIDG